MADRRSTRDLDHAAVEDRPLLDALRIAFRFVATALADPRRSRYAKWEAILSSELVPLACDVVRETPGALADELGPCEQPLESLDPKCILRAVPRSATEWNDIFESTFGLLVSGPAPPYETEYISGKLAFQRSNTLADIAGFYRAFGLDIPEDFPERPDHIAIELEFMACLLELESAARFERQDDDRGDVCRNARRRFFQEHLGWWAPGFATLLADHPQAPEFYRGTGHFLAALTAAQRALLGVAPAERVAVASDPDETGPCDECLAANL